MPLHKIIEELNYEELMAKRCEEEGHNWENGLTPFFEVTQICKWCFKRKY